MAIDIDQSHYNTGTATVAGTAVTGQGTTWSGAVRPGDLFGTHKGSGVRIASVNSNTSLTLAYAVTGLNQTAAVYEIQRTPFDVGYLAAIEDMIRLYGEGNLPSLAALNGVGGDKGVMLTGAGAAGTFPLTAAGRAVAGAADAAAQRTALEVRKAGVGGTLDAINVLGAIQQAGVPLKAIRSISQDTNTSIFTTTSTSLVGSAGSFKNARGLTSSLLALSVLDVEARRTGVGDLGMYASLYRYTGSAYVPVTGAFGGQMLQTGFSLGSGTNIYRSTIVLAAILAAADKRSDGNAWSLNPYFASYYAGCTAQITKHSHIMVEFEP